MLFHSTGLAILALQSSHEFNVPTCLYNGRLMLNVRHVYTIARHSLRLINNFIQIVYTRFTRSRPSLLQIALYWPTGILFLKAQFIYKPQMQDIINLQCMIITWPTASPLALVMPVSLYNYGNETACILRCYSVCALFSSACVSVCLVCLR